ncbi:MAG: hypothetical protein ACOVS5_01355 [Oligoflexus sp.]
MQLTFARLVCAVLLIWLLVPVLGSMAFPDWEMRGQFGDTFGSINALFSGLAFAGLFWALRIQQKQLDIQREELKLQREELQEQRKEMVASRKELAKQVHAQHAMFRATAAQVTVAAVQARIEALKLDAESRGASGRGPFVRDIQTLADSLTALSDWVENGGEKDAAASQVARSE